MRSSLFETLPLDIIKYLSSLLHLDGPSVTLIEGAPTLKEKNAVTAVAIDENRKPDLNRPHVNTYHLIASTSSKTGALEYEIGFCKKVRGNLFLRKNASLKYTTQKLDENRPLLRYVHEDLIYQKYSKLFPYDAKKEDYLTDSQDRVLLRCIEKEIKAAGGLTAHCLQNRTRLAAVCTNDRALMNGWIRNTEGKKSANQVMLHSILQELFKNLCEHESFHEIKEARALLERFPQLLLSQFSGDIVGCAPELTLHGFTFIQKAYLQGNWFFYEMALDVINKSALLSEEKKTFYKKDLLNQIDAVEKGKLEWTLDNLLNKGVRIINADTLENDPSEKERLIEEIVARDGYHLIIKKQDDVISSCTLGYRDPTSKEYTQHEISKTDPLFAIAEDLYQRLQNANDGHGANLSHCFTRDHRDLALVKTVLKQQGIETQYRQTASHSDHTDLRVAIEKYSANWISWSLKRSLDHLHGSIYLECRLFPSILWQFWMSKNLPWTRDESRMTAFITKEGCGAVAMNCFGEGLHPLSNFAGDKFYVGRACAAPGPGMENAEYWMLQAWHKQGGGSRYGGGSEVHGDLIKIYHECGVSKADRFYRRLKGQPEPGQQSSSCCLI